MVKPSLRDELGDLRSDFDKFKQTNEESHHIIINGQNKINERIDKFLLSQTKREKTLYKEIRRETVKTMKDGIKSFRCQPVIELQKTIYGNDKEGGALAKIEGNRASIVAMWLVMGFLVTLLVGIIIYVVA